MREKRIKAIAICIVLIFSMVNPTYLYADNQDPPTPDGHVHIINQGESSSPHVFFIRRRMLDSNGNIIEDKYNFNQKDIRELMKAGFSMKELYQADALGNSLGIDPRLLLDRMRKENTDLITIETEIRADMFYKKIMTKYPKEYQELMDQKFSEDDIITILAFVDLNVVTSLSDFIEEYSNDAKTALEKFANQKKLLAPYEVEAKGGLDASEVLRSRDTMLEKAILLAIEKGIPVKGYVGHLLQQIEGVLINTDER